MALDPTVQVDPNRCICVVGPQIAAEYLSSSERARTPPVFSYRRLVESGIQRVLEVESFHTDEERVRKQTLLVNAYELEPAFASNKVVETLKAHGCYEQWLAEMFSSLRCAPTQRGANATIDHLLHLQDKGMLLVYSHCDSVLDTALGCEPVLPDSEDAVRSWAMRRTSGLLHIHGVHTHPASMKWDCISYDSAVGGTIGGRVLKDLCKTKTFLFVGFDGEYFDPLLPKFAKLFTGSPGRCPLMITLGSRPSTHPSFLTLKFPQSFTLDKVLQPSLTPKHGMTGSEDSAKPINVLLLYTDKNSCLEAADKLRSMNAINASHLQLKLEQFDQLSMCVDRNGLHNLWKLLFGEPTAIHVGLLGINIGGTVTVWLRGNPYVAMERNHGRTDTASSPSSQPTIPLSLSTSVSVISSVWAPITSPTVSKLPPSTRPTLPSPLVCSTTKLSPLKGTPEVLKQFPMLGSSGLHTQKALYLRTPNKAHQQVRRIQSEQDKLGCTDRLEESRKSSAERKNGMLIHQESAPTFVYTSEGVVAYPSDPTHTNISPKLISVPNPSTLATSSNLTEHKIEYIDQYQQGKVASVPGSRGLAQKKQREGATDPKDRKGKEDAPDPKKVVTKPQQEEEADPDFVQAKLKFISEAREWSKTVGAEIYKKVKPKMSNLPVTVMSSGFTMNPLKAQKSSPQLLSSSSVVSPEEQEKSLKQLFEPFTPQGPSPSGGVSMAARLPLKSLSVSTAQSPSSMASLSPRHSPHLSPRRSPKPSPKPSPIQLPMSPKNSPVHPFVIGQSTPGVFSYFPTNPTLPSPAPLLCSPSVSMSPYAAMLTTYQAAMQHLIPPSPQSGKPVVVTDPSAVLQSLQSLQGAVPDKVPCIMPDGTVTFVSMSALTQNGSNTEMGAKEELPKSPSLQGQKRPRVPEVSADSKLSAPKRRRSSSLPDITMATAQRLNREPQETPMQQLEVEHVPQMRRTPPPNMIQIPKEMKLGDPMLGFPTPPQSSPASHLTASPFILSNVAAFHTPQPMTPLTPEHDGLSREDMKEIKEIVEANTPAVLPPSPEGTSLPPFPAGRGPIQLWQFLLDLLLSPDKAHMIQWTGNGYEFRIGKPEEVAKLWGARKNKPKMNYDKLSRGLRYYYSKGIMDKVPGKKLTFKYTCDVQHYVRSRSSQPVHPSSLNQHANVGSDSDIELKSEL